MFGSPIKRGGGIDKLKTGFRTLLKGRWDGEIKDLEFACYQKYSGEKSLIKLEVKNVPT
jgi:hypothetical protein